MRISSLGLSLRQMFRSMTSGGLMSLASMMAVAISLLVLSVIVVLVVNVKYAASTVESQLEAVATLLPLEPAAREQLLIAIEDIEGVHSVIYIPKEEGLNAFRERLGKNQDILADLAENPLPDLLEIRLTTADRLAVVAQLVAAMPGVEEVNYGQGIVEKLLKFTNAVRLAGTGLVILLTVATVLTIANTIRLAVFARRREIAIMKLVGATDGFIRRPFLLEGVALGVLGAGLALLATDFGYRYLVANVGENISFLPMVTPEDIMRQITVYLLLLGAGLGAVGSSISLRRFLRV